MVLLLNGIAIEQLFKTIKFVYLCGTDAKQLNISTNQNKRKFLTTYLDPSFLVFPANDKVRGKRLLLLCCIFRIHSFIYRTLQSFPSIKID